jgi:hypothetical protein
MSEPQVPDDGVKHLTTGNWLEPDPICLKFVEVNLATAASRQPTGDGWAERFLAVDLAPTVPSEVRDMWEAARGLLLYGWFYYAISAGSSWDVEDREPCWRTCRHGRTRAAWRTPGEHLDGK